MGDDPLAVTGTTDTQGTESTSGISGDQAIADLQASSAETMRFQLATMQIQQESSLVSSMVQSANAMANKTEQTTVR